jgi:RimJ/RimL family protein N-acetyltransferase
MPLAVPSLADEVVLLRVPGTRDIDAITAACQDPDIPRFTRIPSPYHRSHAELWVAHAAGSWEAGTEAVMVIVDHLTDVLLGSVGLMRVDDDRNVAEIGYWVAKEARGRGIATRAVRLVSRWAARDLGIKRIELMTRVDNHASQGVATAAGFVREGVLRSFATIGCGLSDVVMFSLVPADLETG